VARVSGLPHLAQDVRVGVGWFRRARRSHRVWFAQRVLDAARTVLPQLGVYGVTAETLSTLEARILTATQRVNLPRETVGAKRAATHQLAAMFAAVDELLRDGIDALVYPMAKSHPEFHTAYQAARLVLTEVDRHAAHHDVMALRQAALAARPNRRPVFRKVASWAACMLAIALAGTIGWNISKRAEGVPPAAYATAIGERSTVPLADGSIVTLNTASVVEVAYEASERRVRLLKGQASFKVAHGQADQPNGRQTRVHAARMAYSRHRVSIVAEQTVVGVTLISVFHFNVLHRPLNDLAIEVLSCRGVGDRQGGPAYASHRRRRVGQCSAVT